MKSQPPATTSLWKDLIHVLFPDICIGCDRNPKTGKSVFCVQCLHDMPYTDHFQIKDNEVTKHLKGRVSLEFGGALLKFREGNMVQNMLHQLKYKKKKEIAEVLGKITGEKLLISKICLRPDIIIPVPIHPKKELKRGYNQSTLFGRSISKETSIPISEDVLIKVLETTSQTGKSRTDRVSNVDGVFKISNMSLITKKHILLVDDVVTTGATLEACCNILLDNGASKISVICIAVAV
ncbi:MAG: ComF family protein [Saprospiraceae bacterium]